MLEAGSLTKRMAVLVTLVAALFVSCSKESDDCVVRSREDVTGKSTCIQAGTMFEGFLSDSFPENPVVRVELSTDVPAMVRSGKADIGMEADLTWMTFKRQYPDLDSYVFPGMGTDLAFAMKKGNDQFKRQLDAFLKPFIATQQFKDAYQGWYDNPETFPMPESVPLESADGILEVAISPDHAPFDFLRDGKCVGVEPYLLTLFANSMNWAVRFHSTSFASVIPYVFSGKAHLGSATLSITEERMESVDFSTPWGSEEMCVLFRRPAAELAGNVTDGNLLDRAKAGFYRNIIYDNRYELILDGLEATMVISFLAVVFGTLLGILLCFGLLSKRHAAFRTSDLYVEFMRRMPHVLLLMILFYIVFKGFDISGVWVATIAFSLFFAADSSVIFASALKSIDKGQTEAALALGFSKFRTFTNFILPQMMTRMLQVYKGAVISLVKSTSVVGYIAVLDLTRASDLIRAHTFESFFPLLVVTVLYFLIFGLMALALNCAFSAIRPRTHRYSQKKMIRYDPDRALEKNV